MFPDVGPRRSWNTGLGTGNRTEELNSLTVLLVDAGDVLRHGHDTSDVAGFIAGEPDWPWEAGGGIQHEDRRGAGGPGD